MLRTRIIASNIKLYTKTNTLKFFAFKHAKFSTCKTIFNQKQFEDGFPFSKVEYLSATENTCEIIAEKVDSIIDELEIEEDYDVGLGSDGVLNLEFGKNGTFVISRQTPRRQLWLSSPKSGPWHYDYDHVNKDWVCTRPGEMSFFERMEKELSEVFNTQVKFKRLKDL